MLVDAGGFEHVYFPRKIWDGWPNEDFSEWLKLPTSVPYTIGVALWLVLLG